MEGLYALTAFILAWFIAQVAKTLLGLAQGRKMGKQVDFAGLVDYFTRSGGMPSGHTASFTALCIYLGNACGWTSGIFALAVATLIVIIYDALHVRYAVGVQGKALNGLLKQAGKDELPVVEGHTMPQVIVGAIIGLVVGFGLFWLINGGF